MSINARALIEAIESNASVRQPAANPLAHGDRADSLARRSCRSIALAIQ
jgi:hypothetical protein